MDITELKNIEERLNQIEEELYRSEDKYWEFVENISEVTSHSTFRGL